MKTTVLAVLFVMALRPTLIAQQQTVVVPVVIKTGDSVKTGSAVIQGVHVSTRGSLVECDQQCDITNHTVRLTADKLTYDKEAGELTATGNVRMTFLGFSRKTKSRNEER